MDKARQKIQRRKRAHYRVRSSIEGTTSRPRLTVFKSSRFIYAQVIDDQKGETLAQANSGESEARGKYEGSGKTRGAARYVGEAIAERAKSKGIDSVVFDRGGYQYHGRVREIAEGARSKGLNF